MALQDRFIRSIAMAGLTDSLRISGSAPVDGIDISSVCSGVAVNITGASVKALQANAIVCASGGYGLSVISTVTDGKSDGIAGYFEGHVAGTPTGLCYAVGAWMNVDSAPGAWELRALDVGMYAVGQDLTGTALIGINIGMHADSDNPPSSNYPIRFNCNTDYSTPDGLFRATNHEAICSALGGAETSNVSGHIAVNIQGTTYYLRYYPDKA